MQNLMKAFLAACAFALAGMVHAAPQLTFVVDGNASSVDVTKTGSVPFTGCFLSACGVEASLAPGLDGTTFSVGTGDNVDFDFLTWTVDQGFGASTFDVTATLAFSSPVDATTTSTGSGSAAIGVFSGSIVAGILNWDDVPATIMLAQGSTVTIDFVDGICLACGSSVSTGASVTGVNVVPVPATLALLGLGLTGMGLALRRRKQMAQ